MSESWGFYSELIGKIYESFLKDETIHVGVSLQSDSDIDISFGNDQMIHLSPSQFDTIYPALLPIVLPPSSQEFQSEDSLSGKLVRYLLGAQKDKRGWIDVSQRKEIDISFENGKKIRLSKYQFETILPDILSVILPKDKIVKSEIDSILLSMPQFKFPISDTIWFVPVISLTVESEINLIGHIYGSFLAGKVIRIDSYKIDEFDERTYAYECIKTFENIATPDTDDFGESIDPSRRNTFEDIEISFGYGRDVINISKEEFEIIFQAIRPALSQRMTGCLTDSYCFLLDGQVCCPLNGMDIQVRITYVEPSQYQVKTILPVGFNYEIVHPKCSEIKILEKEVEVTVINDTRLLRIDTEIGVKAIPIAHPKEISDFRLSSLARFC